MCSVRMQNIFCGEIPTSAAIATYRMSCVPNTYTFQMFISDICWHTMARGVCWSSCPELMIFTHHWKVSYELDHILQLPFNRLAHGTWSLSSNLYTWNLQCILSWSAAQHSVSICIHHAAYLLCIVDASDHWRISEFHSHKPLHVGVTIHIFCTLSLFAFFLGPWFRTVWAHTTIMWPTYCVHWMLMTHVKVIKKFHSHKPLHYGVAI